MAERVDLRIEKPPAGVRLAQTGIFIDMEYA